jgi:RNA polymerase sigma-70 factor (ECF subfamily)
MAEKKTSLLTVDGITAQVNSGYGQVDSTTSQTVDVECVNADNMMAVVERFQGPLLRYVGAMLGRVHHEAEDIVQETFIRFYHQIRKKGAGSVKHLPTWLFRVAHNLTLDMLRKQKRRQPQPQSVVRDERTSGEAIADEMDALGEMLRRESQQVALKALSELEVQYRQVLLLKIIQEMSLRQVAEVVGVSLSTVNYRLNRGLDELTRRLHKAGVV